MSMRWRMSISGRFYSQPASALRNASSAGLTGTSIAVKDNFSVIGFPCTASSNILQSYEPMFDATVVKRLRDSGCKIVSKTAMDEFGMGSFNISVQNPWSKVAGEPVTAGGSSGGSAAAVASNEVFAALGSDTGGSVRMPASFCGIVGMKPTYGRLSRWGLLSYASSLDCPGILARNILDAAHVFSAIDGLDEKDPTSVASDPICLDHIEHGRSDFEGITVGVPYEFNVTEIAPDVRSCWQEAADRLQSLGANVVSVSIPSVKYALPAYYILAPAEASSNLSRYDGMRYGYCSPISKDTTFGDAVLKNRSEGFGIEVKRRILAGSFVLSNTAVRDYFVQAQRLRAMLLEELSALFDQGIDVLLTPSTISDAPTLKYLEESKDDLVGGYLNDIMTIPASLAGLPAISIPSSLSSRSLPLGIQLIGNSFQEEKLFQLAHLLESHTEFPSLSL